jgi:hypothetical protein
LNFNNYLFVLAGISLEGSVIIERKKTNKKFYGRKLSAGEILNPAITPPPPQAELLYRALYERVGYPRTARNETPVFGFEDNGMRDFRARMEGMCVSENAAPFSPRMLEYGGRNEQDEDEARGMGERWETVQTNQPTTSTSSRLNLGNSSSSNYFNPFVTTSPLSPDLTIDQQGSISGAVTGQGIASSNLPPRYSRIIAAIESEETLEGEEDELKNLWK